MADHVLPEAQKALDRMRRASERGTGCHLTADMVQELGLSSIGQMWSESLEDAQAATRRDRPHDR